MVASCNRLTPKLWRIWPAYCRENWGDFAADVSAGLTIGLVALPLALAFAIASGVKPEAGLYTAIVAGAIVSLLGGSRCQIAGPTGAFVVIVAGIVAKFGVTGLLMCTVMAGGLLVLMALTGLGGAVRYIPRPVTLGFTNGIAVLIASTQLKDLFGLHIEKMPSEFLPRLEVLAENAGTFSVAATVLGFCSLALLIVWPRVSRQIPGSLVALFVATAAVLLLGLPVETLGTKFGGIPSGWPTFALPEWKPELVVPLIPSAVTVALLAAIESLLSAVVADNMSGDQHDPDAELLAQGIANLAVPFVGGMPVTGAIARTATNIRSGARSPVAGVIHSATLLGIVLVAAPLAKYLPLAPLAAVLLVVAYHMGEWRQIGAVWRSSGADRLVWALTFGLTVMTDLTIAVQVGMVMAAILFIRRVVATTSVEALENEDLASSAVHVLLGKDVPDHVTIVRIRGAFLFGADAKLARVTHQLPDFGPLVILRLRHMTALDGTGLYALETFVKKVRDSGRQLLVCGAQGQPARVLQRSRFATLVEPENLLPHIDAALTRARALAPAPTANKETREVKNNLAPALVGV